MTTPIPKVQRAADSWYWVANAGNPLPSVPQFSLELPPELVFRRVHLCAYVQNATFANATAAFRFFLKGEQVLEYRVDLNEDTGSTLVAAGGSGRWYRPAARPPFQVTDAATGSAFLDTVATGENGVRFVWRLNTRDISAFCPPSHHTLATDRLVMTWEPPLNVTSAGSALVVAAACVVSSNYR